MDGDKVIADSELGVLIAPGERKALSFELPRENKKYSVRVEAYTVKLLNKVSVEASG